jgi:hypothetical protein
MQQPKWQRFLENLNPLMVIVDYNNHQRLLDQPNISPELREQTQEAIIWDYIGFATLALGPLGRAASLPRWVSRTAEGVQFSEHAVEALREAGHSDEEIARIEQQMQQSNQRLTELQQLVYTGSPEALQAWLGFDNSAIDLAPELTNVSNQFVTRTYRKGRYTYEETSGNLGVPSQVVHHRDRSAQRRVSEGTGDDAGHRIGNRFGAPGDESNLALQNSFMNRNGTYHDLEDRWAELLENGYHIHARVVDVYRPGENRPFMRKVEWEVTAPDGTVTLEELTFANTHTPGSRDQQNIPETNVEGPGNSVGDLDAERRQRRDVDVVPE